MSLCKSILIILITFSSSIAISNNGEYTLNVAGTRTSTAGISPTDIEITFEFLFNEFLKELGEKINLQSYENFQMMEKEFMENDTYNAFYCSSVEFLSSNIKSISDDTNLITIQNGPYKFRKIVLVTRKQDNFKSIKDLKNKIISYTNSSDIVRLFIDTTILRHVNIPAENYVGSIELKNSGSAALIALFFNQVDVAVVYDDEYELAKELNPQVANETKVLAESDEIVTAILGVKGDVAEQRKDLFVNQLIDVHERPKGENLMDLLGASRFIRLDVKDLSSVDKMLNDYKRYMGVPYVN